MRELLSPSQCSRSHVPPLQAFASSTISSARYSGRILTVRLSFVVAQWFKPRRKPHPSVREIGQTTTITNLQRRCVEQIVVVSWCSWTPRLGQHLEQFQVEQTSCVQVSEWLAAQPNTHRIRRVWVGRAMNLKLPARLSNCQRVARAEQRCIEGEAQSRARDWKGMLWVGFSARVRVRS